MISRAMRMHPVPVIRESNKSPIVIILRILVLLFVVDFENFMPIGLTDALFPSNCGNAYQQLETVLFSKGRDSILGTVFLKS